MYMKTKKKIVVLLASIMALCVLTIFSLSMAIPKANTSAEALLVFNNGTTVNNEYICGDLFQIPESVSVKVGDSEFASTSVVLVCPNGDILKGGTTRDLDVIGEYALKVFYNNGGKTESVDKTFSVVSAKYSVSTQSSIATYQPLQKSYNNGVKTITDGINLRLVDSDVFEYRKPIKLNENGVTNIVSYAHVIKEKFEGSKYSYLYFRLTDVYDSNNYILFSVNFPVNSGTGFDVKVGFNGTELFGLGSPSAIRNNLIEYEGNTYAIYYTSVYGTYLTLQYDASTKKVYVSTSPENSKFTSDLGLSDIYTRSFGGFTSNEVYFSCYATDLYSQYIYVDIADIGGQNSLDADNNGTADYGFDNVNKYYVDTDKPTIKVNNIPTTNDSVFAAKNQEFPLYEMIALDENLKETYVNVYYNYGKENQVFVGNNGKTFVPKMVGEYTAVYTAVDTFGNKTEYPVSIVCLNVDSLITMKATQSDFDGVIARVGSETELPAQNVLGIGGINGKIDCNIKAIFESEGVEFDVDENNTFVPNHVGVWKIVYTLKDNVTERTFTYNINVRSTDKVFFDQNPLVPKYFIKNSGYQLDSCDAYRIVNGARVTVTPDVAVRFDGNGEFMKITNNTIESVTGESYVEVQYSYDGKVIYTSDQIEIVDVGYGDKNSFSVADYFKGNFTKTPHLEMVTFTANSLSGEERLDFIKEISLSNFLVEFNSADNKATTDIDESLFTNYNEFIITLTDFCDPNNKVELSIRKSGSTAVFSVNGVESKTKLRHYTSINTLQICYKKDIETFDYEGVKVKYKVPFSTDKCYVSFTLRDIHGQSAISVTKLNNQAINRSKNDIKGPEISVVSDSSNRNIGDKFKIEVPSLIDVLSPVFRKDIKVTAKTPSGEIVTSVDNVKLDKVTANRVYEFEFNEFGDYVVLFEFQDSAKNKGTRQIRINVKDMVAPELSFKDGSDVASVVVYKFGSTIDLKEVVCKDDVDESPKVTIGVTNPHFSLQILDGTTFTPNERGSYRVAYRAMDAEYNSAVIYYYIVVE